MERKGKRTLSGLAVRQAMRRQTIILPQETSIDHSLNHLIKYKVNALLVSDAQGTPIGVVSKSDIMSAYYAGIPVETPLADIMVGPPLFCHLDEPLEKALDTMRSSRVYRLYVVDDDRQIVGVLAYPDIVGLLYKFCHNCEFSGLRQKKGGKSQDRGITRFHIEEVMTADVQSILASDTLLQAMEILSSYRFGALLIRNESDVPCGVISKTDLVLAYKHGVPTETLAQNIMSKPVQFCRSDDLLETAIKTMIYSDVHRLFVKAKNDERVVGVFSLSDAARVRSGSCHACISSRIQLDG